MTITDLQRSEFDRRVSKDVSGCWNWIGNKMHKGYGLFSIQGHPYRAHRLAWRLENGEIPGDLHVLHRCDNRACVNPLHLFLGTAADNIADMVKKGRNFVPRGPNSGNAKLSPEDVLLIRASTGTLKQIAGQFGIGATQVFRIRKRQRWTHL